MTEEKLKYKIEQLSSNELKLLAIKTKDFIAKEANRSKLNKQKKIVAYLEAKNPLNLEGLKTHLKNKLPDYMIPTAFLEIEKPPLLPNGKIDKKALLKLKHKAHGEETNKGGIVKPTTETEEKLVKIWEEVLNFSPISTHDNFFEIGGDSILSIQIISKARKLGLQLTANQLFEHQTISELGIHFSKPETKKEKRALKYLVPLREGGQKKPLFCIHSGGGHVVFYNLLTKYMKPNRSIYALEPSGLYGGGTMHKNIEDMAMDYMSEIRTVQAEGPYNILVYCFSVTVGNEMAIELNKLGHKANIIVMDTMASPWTLNTPLRLKARIKSFVIRFLKNPIVSIKYYFEDRLWLIKPIIAKYFGDEDTRDLENLQENLRQICLAYKFKPNQGDISLILTEKPHQSLQKVIIDSWKEITNGNLKLSYTKGNHRTLFKEPDIAFVSKKIEDALIE